MGDTAVLLWGVFFGGIGLGFFIYGKKQKAIIPLLTGILLFIFPYFITDVYVLVITGFAIMLLPYFVRV
ncbi:MAG: hypothetical protein OEM07_01140 [Gammaproteobacteria bacterium]|nr:hypothetical protein [Gammaproteobacteria bacterium]